MGAGGFVSHARWRFAARSLPPVMCSIIIWRCQGIPPVLTRQSLSVCNVTPICRAAALGVVKWAISWSMFMGAIYSNAKKLANKA